MASVMPKLCEKRKYMYRLIVCDLDGTLCANNGPVRPAVRQAMQAVVDAGLWITLSTGRGLQLLRPFLGQVVVNAPLICCNGGLILAPDTHRILYLQPTSLALAHDVLRLAGKEGWKVLVYLDDMETMLEYQWNGPGFQLTRDGTVVGQGVDAVSELTRPPHKLIVHSASASSTPEVMARLQECLGDRARVVASSPRAVEILMPGISKARGLAWVAQDLGVPSQETIAIGDGDNDIEMLQWAGLGIAMGNGMPGVKAIAQWIAPPVEEDGVAVALRHFVLSAGEPTP
jgi:Cof subfamily protein (haloacid dehalogenase superfamily)